MATKTEVDVAVYMERLDTYIQSQTKLNRTLVDGLARVNQELDELQGWRNKMYGVKTGVMALIILVLHTSAVMASFVAIINWLD